MESLFQAIERFDTKALSEIIEEKKLADSYLNYLSQVYRDYLYSGAIERKINLKKVTASPYRLLLFTHYQNVTRGGYEPKIHTALLDEISKSKDLKWRNRMHLALIQHLRPYIQKEPFLIELLEEYISKVEVKWLSKTNHFLYEKVLFEMYLQKREVKREFKTNTLIKKKLTYLDSLCPNINYYRAGIEQGKAIVALEFEKSKDKALQYLRKSLEYSTLDSYYFGRKKHTYTQNSLGILLRDMGRYKEAIEIFETLLNSPIITKNARSLLKVHISLEKCYAALNLSQKAHYHATVVNRLQDSINHLRQTEVILEKNYDYHLAEKEQKIHLAKAKERSLYQWLLLLIPILGISILMIFFLYRIYQQSRKEVKKIAQMVIKNHIILKDKTKIYINDLLYIKAEDHYIRVYTSDGKNHLVRGKLADLEAQLPPNFMRTHRSYIINRNYIKSFSANQVQLVHGKRIPIGRTFQKKIDP